MFHLYPAQIFTFILVLSSNIVLSRNVERPGDKELEELREKHKITFDQNKLSEAEWETEEYDHDSMLGHERAELFDDLSMEEAKKRFMIIFDKIDKNSNDYLSRDELNNWIRYVTSKFIQNDVASQFDEIDLNNDGKVSWKEYKEVHFDHMTEADFEHDETISEDGESYKEDIKKMERRFRYADLDNDKGLDHEEFGGLIHPEEFNHMRTVMLDEAIGEIDSDGDGKISEREYLADLWTEAAEYPEEGRETEIEEGTEVHSPDWLQEEAESFRTMRDVDGDGFLDKTEVEKWLLGPDFDHVSAEVEHLFNEADDDGDDRLSREEVVENHMDVFVGSQATDFGDVIIRHNEF